MDIQRTLREIGLSEGESAIYLALLKCGSSTVAEIKEATQIHRTSIYDFLKKLEEKNLVSHVTRNNILHYKASNPERILDLLKQKEEQVQSILPSLLELEEEKKETLSVEVQQGEEGLKNVLEDILHKNKNYIIFGLDKEELRKKYPKTFTWFEKKESISSRSLLSSIKKHSGSCKKVSPLYLTPNPIIVYDDVVATITLDPFTIVLTENKDLAAQHKERFEQLWKKTNEQ